jgi:hypothetical protein
MPARHQLQAMQVRPSASWPDRARRTKPGSAISSRVEPTRSQTPDAIAASASAIRVARPSTLSTGTAPAASRTFST